MMALGIIITGFLVGLLVGLTGMGGGLLMTPLLILLYGFSPTMAVGTDLVYSAVTKSAGTWQHFRQKSWDREVVKRLAKGSIPGGIAGVLAIRAADTIFPFSVEKVLGHVLGITFIAIAVLMVFRLIRGQGTPTWKFFGRPPLGSLGFLGGFLVGLTSVGSGSLFMTILISCTVLPASRLVGTDVVHAFILTLVAGIFHASFGHVDWSFVGWLLMGSVPGILIGGRLTLRLPDQVLRMAITILLFFTGLKMV
jgi:uncharacterized protein